MKARAISHSTMTNGCSVPLHLLLIMSALSIRKELLHPGLHVVGFQVNKLKEAAL
jgi:hypothetical protein